MSDDLHGKIMNLATVPDSNADYKAGHRDARHAAAELASKAAADNCCSWLFDEDGPWLTGCGKTFEFLEDGPKENQFLFCPYCGGALVVAEIEGEA